MNNNIKIPVLDVVRLKGLPLSLDHDGLLAAFFVDNDIHLDEKLAGEIVPFLEDRLTRGLTLLSRHLLRRLVPIEVKRVWLNGQVQEF